VLTDRRVIKNCPDILRAGERIRAVILSGRTGKMHTSLINDTLISKEYKTSVISGSVNYCLFLLLPVIFDSGGDHESIV